MLGAIIGDIVGSRFEFSEPPTAGIADAILHHKDYKASIREWCHRYPDPMGGYGNRFYNWLLSDDPHPMDSFGNGSAMRVSPVGWLFDDYRQVIDESHKTAEFTHNHPEGIKGAECVAVLIYWLRNCRITREEIEGIVHRRYGYEIPSLHDMERLGLEGHFDGTCQETVPMAIRCFLESNDFESAIRLAVMADGDTDTKADITGAIAEAFYDLPEYMVEKAYEYLPDDMLDVINDYCDFIHARLNNDDDNRTLLK
jgi:ADP-ribosyl-[dinitrogen reductase] hydrolase